MKKFRSRIYKGRVFHQRFRPKKHRLSYRVFSMFIDLDELKLLDEKLYLFSYNKFGLFSFWDKDHGPGEEGNLFSYVSAMLKSAKKDERIGRISLLCYPRIFGYVFNPLSVYYCYDKADKLMAIICEVNNTFGERHSYIIDADNQDAKSIKKSCSKVFYVSPFMDVNGEYHFRFTYPSNNISVLIDHIDEHGILLRASFCGLSSWVSDRVFASLLLRYPLMTLKVISGIHWEALKLWLKGTKIYDRPPPPNSSVTNVEKHQMETRL